MVSATVLEFFFLLPDQQLRSSCSAFWQILLNAAVTCSSCLTKEGLGRYWRPTGQDYFLSANYLSTDSDRRIFACLVLSEAILFLSWLKGSVCFGLLGAGSGCKESIGEINDGAWLSLISARIAPSTSSFTLVMVFLIGSLQSAEIAVSGCKIGFEIQSGFLLQLRALIVAQEQIFRLFYGIAKITFIIARIIASLDYIVSMSHMNHSTRCLLKPRCYPQTIVFFLFSSVSKRGSSFGGPTFCTVRAQDLLKSPSPRTNRC